MGRIGITYQDIVKIIPKLQAQGKSITVDNARAELNSGSKSTIARLLREWKAQQGLPINDDGSLPAELLNMVKGLWRLLQTKADDAIDGYREEYDATLREIQQQLNQYKAKDTEWQGRIHALEESLHQQGEDNKRLNAVLIAEQQEKIKTTGRVETLQARYQDSQSENERLHQLLKHVQTNLEHYQAETQKLHLEQEIMVENQRANYEQRLLQLQQQIEVIIREKTFMEARCSGLDRDYNALLAREAVVSEEAAQLRQEYIALKVNYDTIEQNLSGASSELRTQHHAMETKNRELIECQFRLEMVDTKIASLENALSAADDKIMTLRDDYLFVVQEKANLEGQVRLLLAKLEVKVL